MIPHKTKTSPAYVFATVNPGQAKKVVEELRNTQNIDLVAPVTGRFDLVLRIKPTTPEQIYETVANVRKLQGIQQTQTYFGFHGVQNGSAIQNQMPFGISLFNVTSPIENVISQLKSFPGLVEAWTVPGPFDIVALWQARTTDGDVKSALEKFPTLHGIARSETLLTHALPCKT